MEISDENKKRSQTWSRILTLEKENVFSDVKNEAMIKKIMKIIEEEEDKCY